MLVFRKVARNLVLLSLILWLLSLAIYKSNILFPLYGLEIGQIPSHLYASRLADFKHRCGELGVLFVGPSTVREGFDENSFTRLTGRCAVNAGVTSQGSIFHTVLQLTIMENLGVRPEIVVVGINSRMLSVRRNPVTSTRYVDFLEYDQLDLFRPYEIPELLPQLERIAWQNRLFPLLRYRIKLDYLARGAMYRANRLAGNWNQLSLGDFSREGERLSPSPRYLYSDTAFNRAAFEEQMIGTRENGFHRREIYGLEDHLTGLKLVIEKGVSLADTVYVTVMPERSELRASFGSYADTAFYEILSDYEPSQVKTFELTHYIDDDKIRDMAHLTPAGREELTRFIAQKIGQVKEDAI